ncbi:unnamed protein product [Echinostoma caproni]|uniref:Transcriptional regulator n=1 Tax=Echinostoma caproni TaxID=27848 RepID=A0A183AS67_9TREM|nr:unnamed protein product [Echinostoma caproni]
MRWAATKDALIASFDTRADRQRTLHSFGTAQLCVGVDSLLHAAAMRALMDRALPTLNDAARLESFLERFVKILPDNQRKKT